MNGSEPPETERESNGQNKPVELRSVTDLTQVTFIKRMITFFAMGAGAMILSCPDPRGVLFAHLFPLGLSYLCSTFLNPREGSVIDRALPPFAYLVYLTLFLFFCGARRRALYRIAIVALACVLVLNIVGCRRMIRGFSGIE